MVKTNESFLKPKMSLINAKKQLHRGGDIHFCLTGPKILREERAPKKTQFIVQNNPKKCLKTQKMPAAQNFFNYISINCTNLFRQFKIDSLSTKIYFCKPSSASANLKLPCKPGISSPEVLTIIPTAMFFTKNEIMPGRLVKAVSERTIWCC